MTDKETRKLKLLLNDVFEQIEEATLLDHLQALLQRAKEIVSPEMFKTFGPDDGLKTHLSRLVAAYEKRTNQVAKIEAMLQRSVETDFSLNIPSE